MRVKPGVGACSIGVALALMGLTFTRPVTALIVWEGKIVEAWPTAAQAARAADSGVAFAEVTGFFPRPSGTVRSLTLLVNFSDEPGAFTPAEIDAWLNEPGYSRFGCNGSVRDYFKDVSNGTVDLVNTVHSYYRAKNPKSYYEGGDGYERAGELLQEMIAAVDADIDFSQFDNDGDGRTEAISVVYAGPAVEWGQGLWPHSGGLNQKRDGVTLSRYQMTNMGESLSLYTFAHETGHMLFGWPDLYGFGDYCLMGNATKAADPAGINDLFRADQGWIPTVEIDASTNATFTATPNGAGYRFVNPDEPREVFFWSNIQKDKRWSVLRGSGLLVLHYNGRIRGNEPPNPLQLAVVQADGKKDLDETTWPSPGSDANDLFGAGTRTEFSATTTPKSSWADGSASGLRVHAISASGADITFSVGTGAPTVSGGNNAGGAGGGSSGRAAGGASSAGSVGRGGAGNAAGRAGDAGMGGTASAAGAAGTPGAPVNDGGVSGSAGATAVLGGASSEGARAGTGGSGSVQGGVSNAQSGAANGGEPRAGAEAHTGTATANVSAADDSGCAFAGSSPGRRFPAWLSIVSIAAALALARRRVRALSAR